MCVCVCVCMCVRVCVHATNNLPVIASYSSGDVFFTSLRCRFIRTRRLERSTIWRMTYHSSNQTTMQLSYHHCNNIIFIIIIIHNTCRSIPFYSNGSIKIMVYSVLGIMTGVIHVLPVPVLISVRIPRRLTMAVRIHVPETPFNNNPLQRILSFCSDANEEDDD